MTTLAKARVGVPLLATLVVGCALLWGIGEWIFNRSGKVAGSLSTFWWAAVAFLPFVCCFLSLLMAFVYLRGRRSRTVLFATSFYIGTIPLLWFIAEWLQR